MFEHIDRRRGRDEKVAQATALSVAVHLAIVLLLAWGVREGSELLANERAGTGPSATDRAGGGGGGGGAEQVTYYEIPTPPPAPPAPAVPVPEEVLPPLTPPIPMEQPEPPPQQPAPPAPPATPVPSEGGAGTGEGTGQGTGTGAGAGPGSGGGTGGGSGGGVGSGTGPGTGGGPGDITPPVQQLLPPFPSPPRGVRRPQEVTIRLSVDTRGRVTRAEVMNSSGDRRFDDTLRRWALEAEYEPARDRAGRAVAAQTDLIYVM